MKASCSTDGVLSQPVMKKDIAELLKVTKKLSKDGLKKLMSISDTLANDNFNVYQTWDKIPIKATSMMMDGPAFRGFDGTTLSSGERKVAQKKVRIISGLYGVLKPFDGIRPYRLEMGSKLKTGRGQTLYEFWGQLIAREIAKGAKVIVNAASQEYFKAVRLEALGVPVVTVDFPGPAVYAKKARGIICRYAVKKNCQKPEDLKGFTGAPGDQYQFDAGKSTASKYVFKRVSGAKGAAAGAKRAASSTPMKAAKKAKTN